MTELLFINQRALLFFTTYIKLFSITCVLFFTSAGHQLFQHLPLQPATGYNTKRFFYHSGKQAYDTSFQKGKAISHSAGNVPVSLTGQRDAGYLRLKYLKVIYQAGGKIELLWEAANNISDSMYVVEKSTDGVEFTQVGLAEAKTGQHRFSDTSWYAENKLLYYRIKAITGGGGAFFSDFIPVKANSCPNKISVFFPGEPQSRSITTSAPIRHFEITDASGHVQYKQDCREDLCSIKIIKLPQGIYSLSLYDCNDHVFQFFFRQ